MRERVYMGIIETHKCLHSGGSSAVFLLLEDREDVVQASEPSVVISTAPRQ